MSGSNLIGISVPTKNYGSRIYDKILTEKGIEDDYLIRGNVYKNIFEKLNVENVIEIRPSKYPHRDAKRVRKFIRKAFIEAAKSSSKNPKPLIIGLDHSAMAYAFGDSSISYLYFDRHVDELNSKDLNCASFINFMEGRHYVIGTSHISETDKEAKDNLFFFGNNRRDLKKAKKVLQKELSSKVFLSVEMDVLDPRFTTAHEFDKDGKMSPRQIKRLSENLLRGRELVGMNVSAYDPCLEHPNYKTVNIIVDILKPFI